MLGRWGLGDVDKRLTNGFIFSPNTKYLENCKVRVGTLHKIWKLASGNRAISKMKIPCNLLQRTAALPFYFQLLCYILVFVILKFHDLEKLTGYKWNLNFCMGTGNTLLQVDPNWHRSCRGIVKPLPRIKPFVHVLKRRGHPGDSFTFSPLGGATVRRSGWAWMLIEKGNGIYRLVLKRVKFV